MQVLGDISRLGAKRHPERTAVVFGDVELSYGQLEASANQFAGRLAALGVVAGDRVGLLSENSLAYPIAVFATLKLGAVLVPLNFRYQAPEIAYVVNDSKPRCVLVAPAYIDLVRASATSFDHHVTVVELDCAELLAVGSPSPAPLVSVDPRSAAMVMYTSGTTGFPKGVLFSHSAYVMSIIAMGLSGDLRSTDRVLVSLPLFHNGGLNALMMPALAFGACAVITPKGFDPELVLGWVQRHRITLTMWVPTMLSMLVRSAVLERFDTTSLSKIWYGSSPISPSLLAQVRHSFRAGLYQFYGLTETGMTAVLRPEDHQAWPHATGREMFCADLRIVDASNQDVAVGEVGEVLSRQSPMGMIGYLNNDDATREAIVDGWIRTGDVARNEGDGIFTIVDRKKDMLISGAENIYPKEVETVLAGHADVVEVAVFGIPDPIYGESVCAAVVVRSGSDLTEEALITWCARRLASYKKPKRVVFVQELPRNAAGKVMKHVLRAPFWQGQERKV